MEKITVVETEKLSKLYMEKIIVVETEKLVLQVPDALMQLCWMVFHSQRIFLKEQGIGS